MAPNGVTAQKTAAANAQVMVWLNFMVSSIVENTHRVKGRISRKWKKARSFHLTDLLQKDAWTKRDRRRVIGRTAR
jgi:nuclear transport factor 2 (NTF2) superfamily protein